MSLKKVTHVIFDLDGTLLDTETVYEKTIRDIAAECGKEYTRETRLKIMGSTEMNTAKTAVEDIGLPYTPEEFLGIYHSRVAKLLQHPAVMPGARELVEHLSKHNIPIAVATSSAKEILDIKIQHHLDLMGLFHHIVCGSSDPEVKHGKPAPDIFLVCASRFPDKPKPDQCLVIEDAPNGAKGAVAAGMQVILIPDPQVPEHLRHPSTLILNSMKEFKPELFGLPAFGS